MSRFTWIVAAVPIAAVLIACGEEASGPESGAAGTTPAPAAEERAYEPVTIDNCGLAITYEQPPQRAVTMNQHATELMLALGLEDRMVGTAYLDDAIHPDLAAAYERVPVLADQYPSREALLGVEPDFVYGGFRSAFGEQGVGPREELLALGISSYLSTAYCPERDEPVTLEDVYTDIRDIARIFGVEERGEELIASMRAEIDAAASLARAGAAPRVMLYDSGDAAPFVGAGGGLPGRLIELAGGENVFADAPGNWAEVSWEEVVERDPEIIILIEAEWSTADEKREMLLSNPALASVTAVREQRFATIPFSATTAGIRNPGAVRDLAEAFHGPASSGRAIPAATAGWPLTIESRGFENIFADIRERDAQVIWEEIIVVSDDGSGPAQETIAFPRSLVAVGEVTAASERVIVMPLHDTAASLGNAGAIRALAEAFHPELFEGR